MKKLVHLAASLVLASSGLFATSASAEISYNAGWASEYYFRGIFQKTSSANIGIEYENGDMFGGGQAIDIGNGLELNAYGGYRRDIGTGFTVSGTFKGYYYTGGINDSFGELNLNVRYQPRSSSFSFSADYSIGEWDLSGNNVNTGGIDFTDDYMAGTVHHSSGLYGTYGTIGRDFDSGYVQVGWRTRISGFDVGAAVIFNGIELAPPDPLPGASGFTYSEDEAVIFSISTSF